MEDRWLALIYAITAAAVCVVIFWMSQCYKADCAIHQAALTHGLTYVHRDFSGYEAVKGN